MYDTGNKGASFLRNTSGHIKGRAEDGGENRMGGCHKEESSGQPGHESTSIRRQIRESLIGELEHCHQISDEELYVMIDDRIMAYGQAGYLPLKEKIALRVSLFDSFRRLGILQELLNDSAVTEIMVNGPGNIFVERRGHMERWDGFFESSEQLEDMIQQIVSRVNRIVNVSRPIADARLEDGSRVHVVLPPVSLDGASMTIRKFPEPITLERLISMEAVTEEVVRFLGLLVRAGYNIFISGGTNSGKSTFLNALSACIPESERVITIEDSAELQIQHVPNLVRLETREANGEGDGAVTIGDLIRASLRMSPNRIIVGEVRGREALDMISAMNTGHDGSLSTGHGNSPGDMLSRLETMVLMGADLPLTAIRSQIASALDILVHLGRLRDRSRKVLQVVEIGDCENGEIRINPLFIFREDEAEFTTGCGERTGSCTKQRESEGKTSGSGAKDGSGTAIPNWTRSRPAPPGKVHGRLCKVGTLEATEKLTAAGLAL